MRNKTFNTFDYLLENGVHLGHHHSKYHPDTSSFILGSRSKIHIIDLEKTLFMLRKTLFFLQDIGKSNGKVLFVCTIDEYSALVRSIAISCNQPYVHTHWIGGLLTNFTLIRNKIDTLYQCSSRFLLHTQGIRSMDVLPQAVIVIGVKKCATAIHEARLLNIPVIGIVDTNNSVQDITYPIPGNDDSILAINMFCKLFANAILSTVPANV